MMVTIILYMYRIVPLLRPPFLRPTFRKNRGGGCNNEDLRFCQAVKPPPHEFAYSVVRSKTRTPSIDMPWQY